MKVPGPPRISVFRDEDAMAQALTTRIAAAIAANPAIVLGLATGRTPIRFYHQFASLVEQGRVDLSQASTFNLDEFLALPCDHPGSFRSFMDTHLFGRVNLAAERIHFLDGTARDTEQECERYEREIVAAGGIDIQILGVGTNGHIGFNEPAPALEPRAHRVTLAQETREANAGLFGNDPSRVPTEALSMGMATILHARSIVLLASGASKSVVIERAVRGPITPELPVSFLQLHHDVEIMVDEAAASRL